MAELSNKSDFAERHESAADLFDAQREQIWSFLRSRVRSDEEADDLVQQTFLRMLTRTAGEEISNPGAYLKVIARSVLVDHYRREQTHKSGFHVEFEEQQHADTTPSPRRLLQLTEDMERLSQALQPLSKSVVRSFLLSRVYGYTYAEIGQILSLSPRTIEKHVAKGLKTCYEHMVEQEADPGAHSEKDS